MKTRAPEEDAIAWRPPADVQALASAVGSFLDTATTSMGRATHDNDREAQQRAELEAHAALCQNSRDLYLALLGLEGLTDRAKQLGLKALLSSAHRPGLFSAQEEQARLYALFGSLPPQRRLRCVEGLAVRDDAQGLKPANNSRTKKLILRTLLRAPQLEFWAIKYRRKMARALTHAWGQRRTGYLREILKKDQRSEKERGILQRHIHRWAKDRDPTTLQECVAFALGLTKGRTLPLLAAFERAKTNLDAGAKLPLEVLEGIRSRFHAEVEKGEVLKKAAPSMSKTQRLRVQKQAKAAKVKVAMDPADYDPVQLYLYAFKQGLDPRLQSVLHNKGAQAAKRFWTRYERLGILLDASGSMFGHATQALKPMAQALALRDMLSCLAPQVTTEIVGGSRRRSLLVEPSGETDLSGALLRLLRAEPQVVFVISDGYENAPAGRFAEVVQAVRSAGIPTPIYHLNPVFAAETGGARQLAPAFVPTLAVRNPQTLGLGLLRSMLEVEPLRGIRALLTHAQHRGLLCEA